MGGPATLRRGMPTTEPRTEPRTRARTPASDAPSVLRLPPRFGAAGIVGSMAAGGHEAEDRRGVAAPPAPWPSSTASLAFTLRRRNCRVGRERVASLSASASRWSAARRLALRAALASSAPPGVATSDLALRTILPSSMKLDDADCSSSGGGLIGLPSSGATAGASAEDNAAVVEEAASSAAAARGGPRERFY